MDHVEQHDVYHPSQTPKGSEADDTIEAPIEQDERSSGSDTAISMDNNSSCNYKRVCLAWLLFFNTIVASATGVIFTYIFLQISVIEQSLYTLEKALNESDNEEYNRLVTELKNYSYGLAQLEIKVDQQIYEMNTFEKSIKDFAYTVIRSFKSDDQILFSPEYTGLFSSCEDIKANNSSSDSSYYFLKSYNNQVRNVYCNMQGCGSVSGGWMRVAKVEAPNCPLPLKSVHHSGEALCAPHEQEGSGCTNVHFSVRNFSYSKVCGQIRAYQVGSPDGFKGRIGSQKVTDVYVDGISIISSSQKHIWTFATGGCSCTEDSTPSFITDDWTCETLPPCGYRRRCNVKLWRSQQCGRDVPWFNKKMEASTDDIIVRICKNQNTRDEDIILLKLELYIL